MKIYMLMREFKNETKDTPFDTLEGIYQKREKAIEEGEKIWYHLTRKEKEKEKLTLAYIETNPEKTTNDESIIEEAITNGYYVEKEWN